MGDLLGDPKQQKLPGRSLYTIEYIVVNLVGERGFEPPTPWSRTMKFKNSKCFIWCRLGTRKPFFLSLQLYRDFGVADAGSAHVLKPALTPARPSLHGSGAAGWYGGH